MTERVGGTGIALVTGGARRIGRAIAGGLAASGWAVAIHYQRSEDEAAALAGEIREAGGRAFPVAADLTDPAAADKLLSDVSDELGPVTCLVNNASVFERDEALDATPESWDRHMSVNLRAPFFLSQAFALRLPGDISGNIINIIDQRVLNLTPHFTSYTLSKAGLWTLTQTLALALAPRIRVNAVAPGPTLPSPRQTGAQFKTQVAATPLHRAVEPSEISAAVQFILASPSMTGQMVTLDSGQHLGWAPASKSPGQVE